MLKSAAILASFLTSLAIGRPSLAKETLPQANTADAAKVLGMIDKLANLSSLSVEQVDSITGLRFHKHGPFQYISDDQHEIGVLRTAEIMVGPSAPPDHQVSGLSLFLQKQEVWITRSQIEQRYGKWPTQDYSETLSKDLRDDWGCRNIRWLKYVRSDGGWNDFAFSLGKTNRLLCVKFITAPPVDDGTTRSCVVK